MKKTILFIVLAACISCSQPKKTEITNQISCTKPDSLLVLSKIKAFSKYRSAPTQELFENIALSFIGTPYVAHTLETDTIESLVIKLNAFDCTTFIETCLALTIAVKNKNATLKDYGNTLKQIRYRNSDIDNYSSRLHYFSEWILNNEQKGFVCDITRKLNGIAYQKDINFMSKHPSAYRQLTSDTTLLATIIVAETQLSNNVKYYIPKQNIEEIEPLLESGLIVAFTTSINGLDIIHTGITTRAGNELRLLHASSDLNKVVISETTLAQYIMNNKLQNGIVLVKVK